MALDDATGDEVEYQANVNQVGDEPVPASRQADRPQQAAERSEEMQRDDAEPHQRRTAQEDRSPALESMSTPDRSSRARPGNQPGAGPGQAEGEAEPDAESKRG